MSVNKEALDAIARSYVGSMTSIRGRRIHRLLMREFARFDDVLPAIAEDGAPALLALASDGSAALCKTDGRGAAAAVTECARPEGATVSTSYDLLKDSLPIVSWTIRHASLTEASGALTISAADLSETDRRRIADILRRLGR